MCGAEHGGHGERSEDSESLGAGSKKLTPAWGPRRGGGARGLTGLNSPLLYQLAKWTDGCWGKSTVLGADDLGSSPAPAQPRTHCCTDSRFHDQRFLPPMSLPNTCPSLSSLLPFTIRGLHGAPTGGPQLQVQAGAEAKGDRWLTFRGHLGGRWGEPWGGRWGVRVPSSPGKVSKGGLLPRVLPEKEGCLGKLVLRTRGPGDHRGAATSPGSPTHSFCKGIKKKEKILGVLLSVSSQHCSPSCNSRPPSS